MTKITPKPLKLTKYFKISKMIKNTMESLKWPKIEVSGYFTSS